MDLRLFARYLYRYASLRNTKVIIFTVTFILPVCLTRKCREQVYLIRKLTKVVIYR